MNKYLVISMVLIGLLLNACESDQLPIGTQVLITPTGHTVALSVIDSDESPSCSTLVDELYQDIPVLISVVSGNGAPVGGAEVSVYTDYSANTFSGPDVLKVYADKNGNGVVDADSELVSGIDADVYKVKTDNYDGTTMVFVRMSLGCAYRGSLRAFVGSSVAQAQFEVVL